MDPSRWTFTTRDDELAVRLADVEVIPYREWRRLREAHRFCCPEYPVRRRLEARK